MTPMTRAARILSGPPWLGIGAIAAVIAALVALLALTLTRGESPYTGTAAANASSTTTTPPATTRPASPLVRIEGTLGAANIDEDHEQYEDHVDAASGDTIQLHGWYYNMEDVDSGLYAADLTVRFVLSTTRSPDQVATVYFTGANTNEVVATVVVNVPPGNVLQFIPGSANWRHNSSQDDSEPSWTDDALGDEVVGAGAQLGDAGPCLMCEATVTVRAKVIPA